MAISKDLETFVFRNMQNLKEIEMKIDQYDMAIDHIGNI